MVLKISTELSACSRILSRYTQELQLWRLSITAKMLLVQHNLKFQPYCGVLSGYNKGLQIWRPSMTAQFLLVFETWPFYNFFIFFQENVYTKSQPNLKFSFFVVLSGYSKELRIWCPSMTAEILLNFKIWLFQWFFFNSNKLVLKTSTELELSAYSRILSRYTQELQVWRLSMTAEIFLVQHNLNFKRYCGVLSRFNQEFQVWCT